MEKKKIEDDHWKKNEKLRPFPYHYVNYSLSTLSIVVLHLEVCNKSRMSDIKGSNNPHRTHMIFLFKMNQLCHFESSWELYPVESTYLWDIIWSLWIFPLFHLLNNNTSIRSITTFKRKTNKKYIFFSILHIMIETNNFYIIDQSWLTSN